MSKESIFFSWEVINENIALKTTDTSFFKYNGSGIPKEICWFFNADDLKNGEKIDIALEYKNQEYEAYIKREAHEIGRCRMFWRSDLNAKFERLSPSKKLDMEYPILRFERVSRDKYSISFISMQTVEADCDNDSLCSIIDENKEGGKKKYYVTKYERNPKNRSDAIRIHGITCRACKFDFEKVYGERGRDFIEVHHIEPLASYDEEVTINPQIDLVCVCSNCHRIIHRKRDSILSIDELINIIEANKYSR